MAMWHYVQGDKRMGPVSEDTLRAKFNEGELPRKTLVWSDGMADWEPAEIVDAFRFSAASAAGAMGAGTMAGAGMGHSGVVEAEPIAFYGYAGFWKRVAASILDSIITGVVGFMFGLVVGIMFVFGASDPDAMNAPAIDLVFNLFGIVVGWLYYCLFESSRLQATPGKLALGIKVTDLNGERIGLGRATGRHFAKIISVLTFFIGFAMAGFTARKQCLHDMIAGCLVVNSR